MYRHEELDGFLPPVSVPPSRAEKVYGATVLTIAGIATALFPRVVADVALPFNRTQQEEMISDAYEAAYDQQSVRVHCVSPEYLNAATSLPWEAGSPPKGTEKRGVGIPFTNTVWLSEKTCADLSELAANPPMSGDFSGENPGLYSKMNALRIAAHEGGHSIEDITQESVAECHALDMVSRLAEELGAPRSIRKELTYYVGTLQMDEQRDVPREYTFQPDCTPANAVRDAIEKNSP